MSDKQQHPASVGGLLRGCGADQVTHQDSEVVAGNVDREALVDMFPIITAQSMELEPVDFVIRPLTKRTSSAPVRNLGKNTLSAN